MDTPLLSIIVPVYNSERYLEQCLSSLVAQVKKLPVEIICINDGSTDSSLDILKNYSDNYSFLRVINQPNCGVSVARNEGIKRSTGIYVGFVDSDDYLLPGALERVCTALLSQKYDCVLVGIKSYKDGVMHDIGNLNSKTYFGTKEDMYVQMMKLDTPYGGYVSGKFIKSCLLFQGEDLSVFFDKDKDLLEDEWFWLQAAAKCNSVLFIDEALYCYRFSEDSLSRSHTHSRNMVEIAAKINSFQYLKHVSAAASSYALARVILTIGGFIRRYYVLQDEKSLDALRPLWKRYPGKKVVFLKRVPLPLKIAAVFCDITMLFRIPVKVAKPFKKWLEKGMEF